MADLTKVNRGVENEIDNLTKDQIAENEFTFAAPPGSKAEKGQFSIEEAAENREPFQKGQKGVNSDGRNDSQIEAARQISSLGGISATDRLLGLDLRPTMIGLLSPPPGNVEFLRHLAPPARRTILRKMLGKQRERMRRLARSLRDRRDANSKSAEIGGESFLEVITGPSEFDRAKLMRAAGELEKAARMLNILDEMLAMQDYTISQVGSFRQG